MQIFAHIAFLKCRFAIFVETNGCNMEQLTKIHKKLVKETELSFFRYLYHEIDWGNRIVGIRGPRGVGKTTLMLQHIKNDLNINDVLYINADDIYFSEHRILDLAERLVQRGIQSLYL